MVIFGQSNGKITEAPGLKDEIEENKALSNPRYGSICGDTCPTCRGTGRIPRGISFYLYLIGQSLCKHSLCIIYIIFLHFYHLSLKQHCETFHFYPGFDPGFLLKL